MAFCSCGPHFLFSLHTHDFIPMAITSTATTHSAPVHRSASNRPPSTLQLLRESLSQEAGGAQPSPSTAIAHNEGAPSPAPFGCFSERQVVALSAPIDRANVR
jgi:hypothetical protein